MRQSRLLIPLVLLLVFVGGLISVFIQQNTPEDIAANGAEGSGDLKLYWFIPDGFRADPKLFDIYSWAEQGILPNIKRMMEKGTYGFSKPVFPGHTPTNFATLLTGSNPHVHGVADGPMHIEGYPLSVVSKSGFSSIAKKVPPIWFNLERSGHNVTLLSVPGSTPPELSAGTTIRGRWGGWGIDFPAIIFQSATDRDLQSEHGLQRRAFEFGPELTKYLTSKMPVSWTLELPESYSEPYEVSLTNWGSTVYGYVYDTTNDNIENFDRVLVSRDKNAVTVDLGVGEWSDWHTLKLIYQQSNDYNIHTPKKHNVENLLSSIELDVATKMHVVRLGAEGEFRIRFLYDGLNKHSTKPSYISDTIRQELGPMVDYVDNFPPQLIYFQEDKETFLEEAQLSLNWHRSAARYMAGSMSNDVVIHDIYTPNQMLTSRWWMAYIDPASTRYESVTESTRKELFNEVLEMYKGIDLIIGEILDNMDSESVFVLSSDHGVVPFNREVRVNNILADHGLLKYSLDEDTGEYRVLWEQSTAVYLKMDGIYINPEGLDGNFARAEGHAYEALRVKVRSILENLTDNGTNPLDGVIPWEQAKDWGLPGDRVADLIIANKPGYGWVEEITKDRLYFFDSLASGYKQGIHPGENLGMLTPFIAVGPGIKPNNRLSKIVQHVDQYPTIMSLIGESIPEFVEGKVVQEVFR